MVTLMNSRERQYLAANKGLSKCKHRLKHLDSLVTKRINDLQYIESTVNSNLKIFQKKIEEISSEKSVLASKQRKCSDHLGELEKEYARIENKQSDTVDTDIWFRGVMKRMKTVELRNHLRSEIKTQKKISEDMEALMTPINEKLLTAIDDFSQAKRNSDKVNIFLKLLKQIYYDYDISSAIDISKVLLSAQKQELTKDEKKENFLSSQFQLSKSKSLKRLQSSKDLSLYVDLSEESLAENVRNKDTESRTRDERDFIYIDLLLYPELYEHLADIEREEIKFDNKNVAGVTKADLERILKLPEQVSLTNMM